MAAIKTSLLTTRFFSRFNSSLSKVTISRIYNSIIHLYWRKSEKIKKYFIYHRFEALCTKKTKTKTETKWKIPYHSLSFLHRPWKWISLVGRVGDGWIQFESCCTLRLNKPVSTSRDYYSPNLRGTRVSLNGAAIISSTRHNLIFKWGRNSLATAICLPFTFPSLPQQHTFPSFSIFDDS